MERKQIDPGDAYMSGNRETLLAPILSNQISLIHGSRINQEMICFPQFCPYSYQILCHVGGLVRGRACPSHMTQNLVTVGVKLLTGEGFLFDPWSMDQADLVW